MANHIYPKLVVLSTNSSGAPEFYTCAPEATQEQIDKGEHYEMAKESAACNGYSGHMIAFDQNDPAAKQLGDIQIWL